MYTVSVGNVGTVFSDLDFERAAQEFEDYAAMSNAGFSRVAGEPVWLVHNEVVIAEYDPELTTKRFRELRRRGL